MRRPAIIVCCLVLGMAALFTAAYHGVAHLCAHHLAASTDDLDWLRREFRLSDAELQRIRQLHEGYLPQCREMCARIAAKRQELLAALAASQGVTPDAEQKLAEMAGLRAQCQTQMLRHFTEVSRAMPPEQGERYLAEMQRLTLGFHDQTEQSMSPPAGQTHGHH